MVTAPIARICKFESFSENLSVHGGCIGVVGNTEESNSLRLELNIVVSVAVVFEGFSRLRARAISRLPLELIFLHFIHRLIVAKSALTDDNRCWDSAIIVALVEVSSILKNVEVR